MARPAASRGRWMSTLARLVAALLAVSSGAPAAQADEVRASAPPTAGWALPASDLAIEAGYQLGTLPNGLRYAIRRNANPAGTALVRLVVEAGSLDEDDSQRGYAHFVEHMAFQGSSHVPPGEMVRLLERQGLAFGADTNASTSYRDTIYKLDLPRSDPALLDTALMLLRETASELSFDPARVARERGVVLAERRERDSWAFRAAVDRQQFTARGARFVERLPIGTVATLEAADAARLRAFWQAHYVPGRAVVMVVGDVDPAQARAAIERHFADWHPAPPAPRGTAGPVSADQQPRESIYLDPALGETVSVLRRDAYQDEPDNRESRRQHLLRALGYAIVNRRLQRIAHQAQPPFQGASFGSSDLFRDGRITALNVETAIGKWPAGLAAASTELRRALAQGFTREELDEALANARRAAEDAAAGASGRHNAVFVGALEALIDDEVVPTDPAASLADFNQFAATITPAQVLAALKFEAVPLDDPAHPALIRFEGRTAPAGGTAALRAAWNASLAVPVAAAATHATGQLGYASFGPAGQVISDRRDERFGIRLVRFANGVRLSLKRTGIDPDRVSLTYAIDGGDLLRTREAPLATTMAAALGAGGLGLHSTDELQSLLAGHTVRLPFGSGPDAFGAAAQTTPRDLALQLRLLAALISDPGYRPEGQRMWRDGVDRLYAMLTATPGAALAAAQGGLISDNDPRFALPTKAAMKGLTFAALKAAIADRLAHGALELAVVGDIDEAATIKAVAETLGALPTREAEFRTYAEARRRSFTTDHHRRELRHQGPADQALVAVTWLTRDDSDPEAKQVLNLLDRVMRIELNEALREKLGKSYSPFSASDPSRVWPGWGTFTVQASCDPREVDVVEAAIAAAVERLKAQPVSADLLTRAREPLLQSIDNALKSDGGWLLLAADAQRHPDRLERQARARERLLAVTPQAIMAAARLYLVPERALPVRVLPAARAASPPPPPASPPAK
ncbi:MAG: insulinase family protein [Proteobacteria bacterium]|nr:insulinase family protein [Pseudomonadota bacterium]